MFCCGYVIIELDSSNVFSDIVLGCTFPCDCPGPNEEIRKKIGIPVPWIHLNDDITKIKQSRPQNCVGHDIDMNEYVFLLLNHHCFDYKVTCHYLHLWWASLYTLLGDGALTHWNLNGIANLIDMIIETIFLNISFCILIHISRISIISNISNCMEWYKMLIDIHIPSK